MIRLLVEISHGWQAKVSKVMTKFRKVFLAQHLRISLVRTPSHAKGFYYFRLVFAIDFVLMFSDIGDFWLVS